MSEHRPWTTEPWALGYNEQGGFTVTVNTPDGATICQRSDWDYRRSESIANARLITASPALYEALDDLLTATEKHVFGDECKEQREAALAALRLANPEPEEGNR